MFGIRSVVSAEKNTLFIILLLDIKEAFTIKYRRNITDVIALLNHLINARSKREFLSFHGEYLFICLQNKNICYASFVSRLFLGINTTVFLIRHNKYM